MREGETDRKLRVVTTFARIANEIVPQNRNKNVPWLKTFKKEHELSAVDLQPFDG